MGAASGRRRVDDSGVAGVLRHRAAEGGDRGGRGCRERRGCRRRRRKGHRGRGTRGDPRRAPEARDARRGHGAHHGRARGDRPAVRARDRNARSPGPGRRCEGCGQRRGAHPRRRPVPRGGANRPGARARTRRGHHRQGVQTQLLQRRQARVPGQHRRRVARGGQVARPAMDGSSARAPKRPARGWRVRRRRELEGGGHAPLVLHRRVPDAGPGEGAIGGG